MKKQISAEIIADSKNELGNRITTFVLTFPRHILAELNTHRMFSRNSASSRAVPFEKMLERVGADPFVPIAWQKDHKGMQGTEYFESDLEIDARRSAWLVARDHAAANAIGLADKDVTKQLVNRVIEPYMWYTCLITATEFENFFHLRCPQYQIGQSPIFRSKKDALEYFSDDPDYSLMLGQEKNLFWHKMNNGAGEIHIMRLAECMWDAMNESTPKELKVGEWHIPFGDNLLISKISDFLHKAPYKPELTDTQERTKVLHRKAVEAKIKIATARCARVSYINYEGNDDYEADIKLYEKLSSMGHWSPMEHCAKAMSPKEYGAHLQLNPVKFPSDSDQVKGWSGNFKGFVQLRKTLTGENIFHECLAHKKNSSYI